MAIGLLFLGLLLLTAGAECLVRGASALALSFRVSPLVVGLTIVAFGTSAPELVVSLQSALAGKADVALGNVVGSNVFNVLFILGISALITPLIVHQQLVRIEVPLLIAVSLLSWGMALDGVVGRVDGLVLALGLVAYTLYTIRQSRRESAPVQTEYQQEFGGPAPPPFSVGRLLLQGALVVVGLGLLIWGARWFSDAAVQLARGLGLSEFVIGVTIVAAGTSLPEVATSLLAAIKGERDIAVGNVIGSNLFNLLGVLGVSAAVSPAGVPVAAEALQLDLVVMVVVAIACLPIFFTGHSIARWEGALFLAYYVIYTTYLILLSRDSHLVESMQLFTWAFAAPLTALTLGIGVWRSIQARRGRLTE